MPSTEAKLRPKESSRRSEIAASMNKFLLLDDDDESVKSTKKKATRKSKSSTKNVTESSTGSSPKGKKNKDKVSLGEHISVSPKQKRTSKRTGRKRDVDDESVDDECDVRSSDNDNTNNKLTFENDGVFGEETLKDDAGKITDSAKSVRKSARKLFDKAVRAASPGRLRRERSKSPGVSKLRKNIRFNSNNKDVRSNSSDNSFDGKSTTSSSNKSPKRRSKSPGRLKKKIERQTSGGSIKSGTRPRRSSDETETTYEDILDGDNTTKPKRRSRCRSKSPGALKKRSKSPGALNARSKSPGALNTRSKSPGAVRKRSKSPGAIRKRSKSPGALRKRPESPGRLKRRSQRRSSDERGTTLEDMLDRDAATKPNRRGSRSVASEPMRKPQRQKSNEGLPQPKQRSVRIRSSVSSSKEGGGARSRLPPTRSTSAYDSSKILPTMNEAMHENGSNKLDDNEENASESYQNKHDQMRSSIESSEEFTVPLKEQSYSIMQDELARHKVKRNKSMVPFVSSPSPAHNNTSADFLDGDALESIQDDLAKQRIKRNKSMVPTSSLDHTNFPHLATGDVVERRPALPRRAESMMLHREAGRRGKSESLADLVQYTEEEIHSTSYFASNHVLINRERMKRGLRPLSRNIAMDDLARKSAEVMAKSNGLNPLPTTYVGNVLRGETIRSIHRSTMLQKQGRERLNLLNPYFQDFGVGTCKGEDGMLYMCQLFSERLELALTDTISKQNDP